MVCLGLAAALILNNFKSNLVFFYSPSEIISQNVAQDKIIRIGGLVEKNSINKLPDGLTTEFTITDLTNSTKVRYTGMLPPMFREEQGMVAKGKLNSEKVFIADSLLTKHDEKYMPPEVADALKKSGQWKEEK